MRNQDRDWRQQVNSARAEAAAVSSRLKSREAALAQATADVEELHKQAGQLKAELDDKSWELDCAAANLQTAAQERDAALEKLKAGGPTPLPRSTTREPLSLAFLATCRHLHGQRHLPCPIFCVKLMMAEQKNLYVPLHWPRHLV